RNRHLDYFVSLAEAARGNLTGPDQRTWFDLLEFEIDNFRVAMDWSIESANASRGALLIGGSTWRFWGIRGHFVEGRSRLVQALVNYHAPDRVRADGLNGLGCMALVQGDLTVAHTILEETLSLRRELGDSAAIARSLTNLATTIGSMGDGERAIRLYEEALAIGRSLNDRRGVAAALTNLGSLAYKGAFITKAIRNTMEA